MVVENQLVQLGYEILRLELGEVDIAEELSKEEKKLLSNKLQEFGFEIIDDKKSRTIEKVKNAITDLVQNHDGELANNLSSYLSTIIHQDYTSVSKLFSEVEGQTIEKYFIAQKIERIKELLVYDELTLNEIADELHYSSAAYLSNQFKRETGFSPSYYKQLKEHKRKSLDLL